MECARVNINNSGCFSLDQNNNGKERNFKVSSSLMTELPIFTKPKFYSTRSSQTTASFDQHLSYAGLNDNKCHFYTGYDLILFNYLFDVITRETEVTNKVSSCLCLKDQFLLVFIKFRHNLTYMFLSHLFNIDRNSVSNIFKTWVKYMYYLFKQMDFWSIKLKLPHLYTVILDCTEMFTQHSNDPIFNQLTFSNYKNFTTFKSLIGIDEAGVVIFISDLYGGAISDREIIINSGFIDKLEPGDSVSADRGFEISDLLEGKQAVLNIPPFLRGKSQLSADEVQDTRAIANRRILIEQVNSRAKINKILDYKITPYMRPLANKIVYILFSLVNIQTPFTDLNKKVYNN